MSSNNPHTPNTGASTGSQRSAASSAASMGDALIDLFGLGTKRQESLLKVKPSSAKRSKFNINKSPNASFTVPANNIPGISATATVHLIIKVLPDKVKQPITALIVCPTGYSMDCHLSNTMFAHYSDNHATMIFIDSTGATHCCFDIKVEGGEQLVKYTKTKNGT